MKIAVTAQGGDLASAVDPRFGRAKWFIVVDSDTGEHEAIDNSAGAAAPSGAGIASAQRIADAGAQVVLTGHCGPNAERVLTQAGVRIVEGADGSVADALSNFKSKQA